MSWGHLFAPSEPIRVPHRRRGRTHGRRRLRWHGAGNEPGGGGREAEGRGHGAGARRGKSPAGEGLGLGHLNRHQPVRR